MIDDWKNSLVIEQTPTDPGPVELTFDGLSRDGEVNLAFNQDMIIPNFIKNIPVAGRRLIEDKLLT